MKPKKGVKIFMPRMKDEPILALNLEDGKSREITLQEAKNAVFAAVLRDDVIGLEPVKVTNFFTETIILIFPHDEVETWKQDYSVVDKRTGQVLKS